MAMGNDLIFSVFFVMFVATATFLIIFFKNDPMSRKKVFEYNYLAKLILFTLPFIAIIGVLTPTIVGLYNLALLGVYMAVPMIIGPLIYNLYFYKWVHKDDFQLEEV
jgi:heme/copper-type cytochrome/quinol oxidase subunit 2